MATLGAMSRLSDKHRFVARSIPEVAGEFADLVYQLGNKEGFTFRGRKLGMEAAINAVMLEFLGLDPDARREVIGRNLRRFEALLDDDAAGDDGAPDVGPSRDIDPDSGRPARRRPRRRA